MSALSRVRSIVGSHAAHGAVHVLSGAYLYKAFVESDRAWLIAWGILIGARLACDAFISDWRAK